MNEEVVSKDLSEVFMKLMESIVINDVLEELYDEHLEKLLAKTSFKNHKDGTTEIRISKDEFWDFYEASIGILIDVMEKACKEAGVSEDMVEYMNALQMLKSFRLKTGKTYITTTFKSK